MSFASGLFSFLGGASAQYREEVDAKAAREAAAAVAALLQATKPEVVDNPV